MARVGVDLVAVGQLHDLAQVHDRHTVADVLDDPQVVRDEEVGQAELLLQVLQQVDDLRLDRDVERGHRLVGDDEARLHRQGARDADPLALAAAELVRVAVVARRRAGRPRSSSSSIRLLFLAAARQLVDFEPSPTIAPTRMRGLSEP